MSLRSRVLKGAALAVVMSVPALAYADTDGAVGSVASVSINEPSADDYGTERGNIIVNEGSANRKYQWGGTACSGRNLSDASIALLVDAMRNKDTVQILPSYKPGTSQARCLVGFRLATVSQGVAQ